MSLIDIYAQQFLEEVPSEIDPPHEFSVEEVKAGLNFYDDLKEQVYIDIAIKATDLFNA